jgi:chromosome segregation ATPase
MADISLKDAIANVQGLRNLFRGLEKVEETLKQAQIADNLAAERQKLIDDKTNELGNITGKVNEAKAAEAARALEVETAHTARVAAINEEFENLVAGLEFAKKEMARETAEAQAARDAAGDTFAAEIRELTQTRDALQQSVEQLQAEFAALKDRAARV